MKIYFTKMEEEIGMPKICDTKLNQNRNRKNSIKNHADGKGVTIMIIPLPLYQMIVNF